MIAYPRIEQRLAGTGAGPGRVRGAACRRPPGGRRGRARSAPRTGPAGWLRGRSELNRKFSIRFRSECAKLKDLLKDLLT